MWVWMVNAGGGGRRDARPKGLSREDFARLFREASRRLWCIAAAILGDAAGADDVVQDAAIIAMGKVEEFDPSTSFAAWVGQIVRFSALNELRRRRRERTVRNPGADEVRAGISEFEELDEDVRSALGVLDETARACLLMKLALDLSYAEIASALSIPEGTAMSHVSRSRRLVREAVLTRRAAREGSAA